MNDNQNGNKRLSGFLNVIFSHPAIKISIFVLLALASVVLLVRMGQNIDKDMMLSQTPVVCFIAFITVYFILWIQSKNCSSHGLDVFELVFLVLFVCGTLFFGIKFLFDIKYGYLPTLPGLLLCLCALTLFHSRRKDR